MELELDELDDELYASYADAVAVLAAALVLDDMVSPYDIEQDAMQSSEEL